MIWSRRAARTQRKRRTIPILQHECLEDRVVLSFSSPNLYGTGGVGPLAVAVGDFNGDGRSDLAVANRDSVGVLLGTRSGSFAPAVTYHTGGRPKSVVVGDFDGDGKPDLAVAVSGGSAASVVVLRNTGKGSFALLRDAYDTGGYGTASMGVGDFDGDGALDLAVANEGSHNVAVLRNLGPGGTPLFDLAATFETGGQGPTSLAVGDFDGDGKPDLAVANSLDATVGVLRNTGAAGTPMFAAAVTYGTGNRVPYVVAVGDFDGDGKLDLAATNGASVGVLRNTGAGSFAAAVTYPTGGSGARPVAVGDFDGDGKPDLAVGNVISNDVGVLRNSGTGTFAPAATSATGGSYLTALAAGDFNGDGKLDLVVANYSSDNVSVLLNSSGSAKGPRRGNPR